MNKNATIWTVVGVIVIIAIIVLVSMRGGSSSSAPATTADQQAVTTPDTSVSTSTDMGSTTAQTYTVTYSDSGFSPNTLTIKNGDTVTFVNTSSNNMWVASDPHPTHEGYSGTTRTQHCPDTLGTAFDQCSTGDTYSFTFLKSGTWGYHNHAVDEDKGTIIVQ